MPLTFKFRADGRRIIEADAVAISDKVFQLGNSNEIVREMIGAGEYAFRIPYLNVTFDWTFSGSQSAARAFAMVTKECPLPNESASDRPEGSSRPIDKNIEPFLLNPKSL